MSTTAASHGCCSDGPLEGAKAFKHQGLARFCYFVLGSGFLVGWNAFLTASDYFNAVFPGRSVDRVFTITYLPITLLLIGLVSRWPRQCLCDGPTRVMVGYSLFTLACAAVPVIDVALVQHSHHTAAYALVLLAVVLVAVGDGITQPTVYADAAIMPDSYTQCVVMGAAASGVILGVLRMVTKGALPHTPAGLRTSTHAYFAAAAAITVCALALYVLVLPRLDVVAHYRARLAAERAAAAAEGAILSLETHCCGHPLSQDSCLSLSVTTSRRPQEYSMECQQQQQLQSCAAPTADPCGAQSLDNTPRHTPAARGVAVGVRPAGAGGPAPAAPPKATAAATCRRPETEQQQQCKDVQQVQEQQQQQQWPDSPAAACGGGGAWLTPPATPLTWLSILRLNWRLCAAGFLTYAVTLSIFPGFLAENVHSVALADWFAVLLIATFNVSDFLGRCVPECGWQPHHITLLLMALARLALIPLYAGLAVHGAGEAAFFALTACLGLTNGWLTALVFCAAPRGLPPSAAELAGMVNVFAELAGLNVGAFLGWIWTVGKVA